MKDEQDHTRAPPPGFEGDTIWTCGVPGCEEIIEFFGEEADVIGFLIVHHLANEHGLSRADIVAYDELLRGPSVAYEGYPEDSR